MDLIRCFVEFRGILGSIFNEFNLNVEGNFPSYFSTIIIFLCALVLALIAYAKYIVKDKYRGYWIGLSIIFLSLSVDEAASLHEVYLALVGSILNVGVFLRFSWVIPAMILLSLFCFRYFKFWLALPPRIRFLFLTAGAIFIFGAAGVETLGGIFINVNGENLERWSAVPLVILTSTEEILEQMGILVFLYALLSYTRFYIGNLWLQFGESKLH